MRLIIYAIVALYVFFQSSEYFYSTHKYEDKDADTRALYTTLLACALLYCLFWMMDQVSGANGTIFDFIALVLVLLIIGILSYRKRKIYKREEWYQNIAGGNITKLCPQCGETILASAVKCRYCGSNLVEVEPGSTAGVVNTDNKINQNDLVFNNGEGSNHPGTITREKKQCPNCGEMILAISAMCPNCGQDLKEPGHTEILYPELAASLLPIKNRESKISEWEEIYQREAYGKNTKLCPYCGETVLAVAIVCRYCGQDLVELVYPPLPAPEQSKATELTNQADIILDMDNPGLAPDPDPVPEEEADRRAALWVAGTLFVMSTLVGLIYLATR